jgi:hypothetical protein
MTVHLPLPPVPRVLCRHRRAARCRLRYCCTSSGSFDDPASLRPRTSNLLACQPAARRLLTSPPTSARTTSHPVVRARAPPGPRSLPCRTAYSAPCAMRRYRFPCQPPSSPPLSSPERPSVPGPGRWPTRQVPAPALPAACTRREDMSLYCSMTGCRPPPLSGMNARPCVATGAAASRPSDACGHACIGCRFPCTWQLQLMGAVQGARGRPLLVAPRAPVCNPGATGGGAGYRGARPSSV